MKASSSSNSAVVTSLTNGDITNVLLQSENTSSMMDLVFPTVAHTLLLQSDHDDTIVSLLTRYSSTNDIRSYIIALSCMNNDFHNINPSSLSFEKGDAVARISLVLYDITKTDTTMMTVLDTELYAPEIVTIISLIMVHKPLWIPLKVLVDKVVNRSSTTTTNGPIILTGVTVSQPPLLEPLLESLSTLHKSNTIIVLATLEKLPFKERILHYALHHQIWPEFVLSKFDDLVSILLLPTSSYLYDYIKNNCTSNNVIVSSLRKYLIQQLSTSSEKVLRVYLYLMAKSKLFISGNEFTLLIDTISSTISSTSTNSTRNHKFILTSLATITLACVTRSEVLTPRDSSMLRVEKCITSLYNSQQSSKSVFHLLSMYCYKNAHGRILSEILLLFDVVSVDQSALVKFGDLLIKPLFPEQVMTRDALLSDGSTSDDTSLRVLYILLLERSFLRHRNNSFTTLEEWICKNVRSSHSLGPCIMKEYAECCAIAQSNTTNTSSMVMMPPLSHKYVLQVITACDSSSVLIALYVFYFNASYRVLLQSQSHGTKMMHYPIHKYPIRKLYYYNINSTDDYAKPILAKFIAQECPEVLSSNISSMMDDASSTVILRKLNAISSPSKFTWEDLINEPYSPLRLVEGGQSTRETLLTVLEIVAYSLQVSSSSMSNIPNDESHIIESTKKRETFKRVITVQLLLEILLATEIGSEEVLNLISRILSDNVMSVLKVLHQHQGYDPSLVKVLVSHLPTVMKRVLDFITIEENSDDDDDQQQQLIKFKIIVIKQLVEKYPHHERAAELMKSILRITREG